VPYDADEVARRHEQTIGVARIVNAHGGLIDTVWKGETEHLREARQTRGRILDMIADRHDHMRLQYWILLEGYIECTGWHAVNHAGWQTFQAVRHQDLETSPGLSPWRPSAPGSTGRRPEVIVQLASRLRDSSHSVDLLNPARFTLEREDMLFFNPEPWAEFRIGRLVQLREEMENHLPNVRCDEYAVQIWKKM